MQTNMPARWQRVTGRLVGSKMAEYAPQDGSHGVILLPIETVEVVTVVVLPTEVVVVDVVR